MAKKIILTALLALALVFAMTVVGCDDGSTDNDAPQTIQYEGKDVSGNTYVLTVTEQAGRAAYTPAEGDSYVLIIKITGQPDKKSSGTIKSISVDGTFNLQPSVEGSATFNIVISNGKINSIVGAIAIEEGTPITAGTFDTIYLRAVRWVNTVSGEYGEQWTTGACVKISDFIDNFEVGNTYTVKISGTVDKQLIDPCIQFGLAKNGKWFGNLGVRGLPAIDAGSFERTITLTTYYGVEINQDDLDGTEEPVAQFYESLNYHNPAHPEWDNEHSTIPEDIQEWTIMATIRNFSMIIQE